MAKLEVLLLLLLAAQNTVICFNTDGWLSFYHVKPHKYNDIAISPSSQLLKFSCVDRLDEPGLSVWVDLGKQKPL